MRSFGNSPADCRCGPRSSERGFARARNRAVDFAEGDYVVWTDDDVVVDRGWLAAYVEAFRRRPEAVFSAPRRAALRAAGAEMGER